MFVGHSKCRKRTRASGAGWELEGLQQPFLWLESNQLLMCAADEGTCFDRQEASEGIQL